MKKKIEEKIEKRITKGLKRNSRFIGCFSGIGKLSLRISHYSRVIIIAMSLAGLLLFWLFSSRSLTPNSSWALLSSEAEEAMNRGLASARLKEWQLAIKYFSEAQEAAPYSPKVLFNLGLANDKAGTRELIACAWYRAYLAALPDSTNARQVQARILELEVTVEANAEKLIKKAEETAKGIPDKDPKAKAYVKIAEAQIKAGLGKKAKKMLNQAKRLIAQIHDDDRFQSYIYHEIALAYARMDDLYSALQTAAKIPVPFRGALTYEEIAELLISKGDKDGARKTLSRALELVPKIDRNAMTTFYGTSDKNVAFEDIATCLAMAGDTAGARKTASQISENNGSGPLRKAYAYHLISQYLLMNGNIASALQTLNESLRIIPEEEEFRLEAWIDLKKIVEAQIRAGDIPGACKTAARISPSRDSSKYYRDEAFEHIVSAQAKAGDISGARKTAESIVLSFYKVYAFSHIAEAQAKAGDISAFHKTLGHAKEAALGIRDEKYASYYRARSFWRIAYAHRDHGEKDDVRNIIQLAIEAATGEKANDLKAEALGLIANRQHELGDMSEARKTLEMAMEAANGIESQHLQARYFKEIANYYASFGDEPGENSAIEEYNCALRRSMIQSWTHIALKNRSTPSFSDWQGFIESLKSKEPYEVVISLAETAGEMAAALKVLRDKENDLRK